jgi:hypothetical protein
MNYTVFHSKQITDAERRYYTAKYPTFSYKKGDMTYIVVCHGGAM